MGKGSNGNTSESDPGIQEVEDPPVEENAQNGMEGNEGGGSSESEKRWQFELEGPTPLARTLQGGEQVYGEVIDNRLQVVMDGRLLGYCPSGMARQIRAAMNGKSPDGEVVDTSGPSPTVELRL